MNFETPQMPSNEEKPSIEQINFDSLEKAEAFVADMERNVAKVQAEVEAEKQRADSDAGALRVKENLLVKAQEMLKQGQMERDRLAGQ